MDERYFAEKVEGKWQRIWQETAAFAAKADSDKPKFYQLEMLPYPSGNLHMGHVRNYSAGDAVAWYQRLKGSNVLHPIGWDSFGQPAEDAAIKRGVNPREWTDNNITAMQGQLQRLGLSYDWSRQMAAHRPDYYKFDQWFFLKMLERGLAYKKTTEVNWCETDKATLSNEQASGGLCWRCGNAVTKKELEQWFFKTTAYTDALLDDMAEIESGWPQNVIKRQRDWIGRSQGAYVDFAMSGDGDGGRTIRVFTTRIDTIFGATAVVVAAEHPVIVERISEFSPEVLAKIQEIRSERMNPTDHEIEAEKDGIDTGLRAVNPFSGEAVPVWIGNYVMMDYGTGAVMSVPGHDERDHEFAEKFGLPIRTVILPADATDRESGGAFTDYGILADSGEWSGKSSEDAKREMAAFAEEKGFGSTAVTYRLRDWGISRQRFWGSPIPIVYCDECGTVPVKFEDLPVELPVTAPFTGTGESPLAKVPEFVNTTCPSCGGEGRRETDTMDTFVDSSWYFYRYLDPQNPELPFDPAAAARWTPVDQYIGGDDHAVMHLIYARFWTKMMRDLGLITFNEPFKRLLTQGMVVGETFFDASSGKRKYFPANTVRVERDEKGRVVKARNSDGTELSYAIERMSKSKGNGVDPDEMVDVYGADAARIFVLFAAPIENELVWQESGIEGAVRFLQRIWRVVWKWRDRIGGVPVSSSPDEATATTASRDLRRMMHQVISRVDTSLGQLQFNTPVAALMELTNAISGMPVEPADATADEVAAVRDAVSSLALLLTPFAPHAGEEIFAFIVGNDRGIVANDARFPAFIAEFAKADEIEIPVQVNGKIRAKLMVSPEITDQELRELALAEPKVQEYVGSGEVAKVIIVPKRLINIAAKPR